MNQIILTGRLTRDAELRYTQSNKPVANFTLAVNRIGQEESDFINCVVWNGQAENLCKYQGKGSLILVSGSLRTDKYQDNEGNTKYRTYVLANNIEYLESKKSKEKETTQEQVIELEEKEDPFKEFGEEIQLTDEDLPF